MNVGSLQKLYEVGQRILRERLPLGFGSYDCGTFACFAGWYLRDTGIRNPMPEMTVMSWVQRHFSISYDDARHLFTEPYMLHGYCRADDRTLYPGPAAYAELERRMEYLAGLIREAGGTVPDEVKHTSLPDIVRDIFRVSEAA